MKNDGVVHDAKRLIAFLGKKKESLSPLLILTHDYPDPDSLASAFALDRLADFFGIKATIAFGGIIGRMENRQMKRILRIPARPLRRGDYKSFSNIALVDTQPVFHNNSFPENRKATIVIDQHKSSEKPHAELSLVNPECGATSVILAQALLISGIDIPVNLATSLAYGIITDTLNLYRADRPIITQTYQRLLPKCDMKALARIQNPVRSKRFFSTLAIGIQNAMMCRGLMVCHLGTVDTPDLISQTTEFFLSYSRVKWALCTGRYKSRLHVSFRSVNLNVEAGEILRDAFDNRAHAGGHGSIAGGSLPMPRHSNNFAFEEQEFQLVERIRRRLRIPKKSEFYFPFR